MLMREVLGYTVVRVLQTLYVASFAMLFGAGFYFLGLFTYYLLF